MIAAIEATRLAELHAAGRDLGHEDYSLKAALLGRLAEGWLFEYSVVCLRDIPLEDLELFAGAGGFTISPSTLEIRDLTVPELIQAIQRLGSSGSAF